MCGTDCGFRGEEIVNEEVTFDVLLRYGESDVSRTGSDVYSMPGWESEELVMVVEMALTVVSRFLRKSVPRIKVVLGLLLLIGVSSNERVVEPSFSAIKKSW